MANSVPIPLCTDDLTLLEALVLSTPVEIPAPCGGNGRCGKCRVHISGAAPPPLPGDRRFITEEELTAGVRLACLHTSEHISAVEVPVHSNRARVKDELPAFATPPDVWRRAREAGPIAIALDVGTTTVAAYAVDTATGAPLSALSEMNRQSLFGADVLSRIAYGDRGERERLRLVSAIRSQIGEMIGTVTEAVKNGARPGMVIISGNTTMLHIVAGVDPSPIGRAPFRPEFTETLELGADAVGHDVSGPVILLPAISGYVGGDITSAAVAVDLDRAGETTVLVDIGTNGEAMLRHDGALIACATAAGPAFEGAVISSGVGGVSGAVTSWKREDDRFVFDTIAGEPPVGICGSGLLDMTATLVADGVVDETGRMNPAPCGAWDSLVVDRDDGAAVRYAPDLYVTQRDLREVQLAKAAIRAGIDVLCDEAGITAADISRVVLTGGFGSHLRPVSAVRVGLLPPLPASRFVAVDNAAGKGAVQVIRNAGSLERMEAIAATTRYVELSGCALFSERYIEYMTFEEVEV